MDIDALIRYTNNDNFGNNGRKETDETSVKFASKLSVQTTKS